MFRSGCAGDTKGGAYGDPIRAMNIEEVGFVIGLVGLVLAALATFTITQLTTRMRISIAVAILLLGFIAMEIMDIELEAYGVRRCSGAAPSVEGSR